MPKSLLIEVVGGPLTGQTFSVRENGTLLVGRLPECEISIPQDLTVSRQHFRIEYAASIFQLVHLSQTGETLVNGNPTRVVELHTGDTIEFGTDNKFQITLQEIAEGTLAGPTQPRSGSAGRQLHFTATPLSCGWTAFQGQEPEFDSYRIMEFALSTYTVFTIFDFNRMKQPVPPEIEDPTYLFPWLDTDSTRQFTPIFAEFPKSKADLAIIQRYWGRDGVVCFGSNLKQDELLNHWRNMVGVVDNGPGPSMTVYFWPSLLNSMLQCQPQKQLQPFLSQLTSILVESDDSPGKWSLFADESFEKDLNTAGFGRVDPPMNPRKEK